MSKERSRYRAWLLAGLALAAGVGLASLLDRPRVKLDKDSRILLVGDSQAQGLDPHLRALAKDAGYPFHAAHKVGSSIAYWKGQRLDEALKAASPSMVLVVLGTNDFAGKRSALQLKADASALLAQLGEYPRPGDYGLGPDVLWVSPLALIAAAHPEAMLGLEEAVRSPPPTAGMTELFDSTELDIKTIGDQVHATALGYASWAGAIWKRLS